MEMKYAVKYSGAFGKVRKQRLIGGPKKNGAMNHLKWFPTKNQPVFQGITSNRPKLVEMIQ